MGSVIYMITASAIDSLFESSSFRAIELFFFYFVKTILINYIVNDSKHAFNYYKHTLYLLYTL